MPRRDSAGWVDLLVRPRTNAPDGVLVVAEKPLRDAITELSRTNGYEAFAPATPLDAIQILERRRSQIGHAFISSVVDWGRELRTLLAEEYPSIGRIILAA